MYCGAITWLGVPPGSAASAVAVWTHPPRSWWRRVAITKGLPAIATDDVGIAATLRSSAVTDDESARPDAPRARTDDGGALCGELAAGAGDASPDVEAGLALIDADLPGSATRSAGTDETGVRSSESCPHVNASAALP
jgi:hypothetical protein